LNIQTRPAKQSDADFLAWAILTAGRAHVKRGIWDVILAGTDEENLSFLKALAITELPHLFHFSCYLIAELDGAPAGALGGYDPDVLGYDALKKALPEVFRKLRRAIPDLTPGAPSSTVLACIPESVEGAYVIDSVATLPEFRSRGIATTLLEEMIKRGRDKGFKHAQISIYIGNRPAQHLYEKLGFKVVDEKRSSEFEKKIGSPGMARLLRDL
jgi:ribosomal protein S18 acetylase RimI-like enzyme